MTRAPFTIVASREELTEGLFGQLALFVLELLPFLHAHNIFPAWRIESHLYGTPPGYVVIPSVFDLSYAPPADPVREVPLLKMLGVHGSILGNDWVHLNTLWSTYFRIPQRILSRADELPDLRSSLGVHYRGTDKNTSIQNPVTQDDMLTLSHDWIKRHPDVRSVFVATDEFKLVDRFRAAFPVLPIINCGAVVSHKQEAASLLKADRALLDCVLLSRCGCVLKCSSALSGFAKVLNPHLEIYRVAACELYADIPYFPDAYIPALQSDNPECRSILKRTMETDWTLNRWAASRYNHPFRTMPRYNPFTRLRRELQFRMRGEWFRRPPL